MHRLLYKTLVLSGWSFKLELVVELADQGLAWVLGLVLDLGEMLIDLELTVSCGRKSTQRG